MQIKLLASAALAAILLLSVSSASADESCMRSCQARGYEYGYCQSRCSGGGDQGGSSSTNRPDQSCMRSCQSRGGSYDSCRQSCGG